MNKRLIILSAIFAVLCTSCAVDPLMRDNDGAEGTTTITFTPDFGDIAGGPDTKAFGINPQVQNLYLAVFNEDGTALVEYVKAESVQLATQNEPTRYSYKASLKITNKKRVVHLIANAPEEIGYGSAEDAVGSLLYNFDTDNWTGQDAYWGYLELPNGICAQSDVAGCNALIAKFSEVKLVRNFAQIKVSAAAGSNLEITRFWISNFPDRSSAAPYNRSARRFETAYSSYEYATSAMNNGYEGFCPATAGLVSLKGLDDDELPDIAIAPGGTAFTYERELPESDPLCIIVGGTSTDLPGGDTETFYKIDLRDNSGKYIPILRNFIYEVSIGNVLKVGEPTVEAALNSVSSGAIDTDLSLKDLKDLSNGKSRIAVSETERVIFADGQFKLFYSFIPDIESGTVVNKTLADWVAEGTYGSEQAVLDAHKPYVTVASESYGESGNVIYSFTIATTDETDGYRAVTMVPVPVGGTTRTEVFTVTGHVWNSVKGDYETLQRTVSYQMRQRPQMVLKLSREGVMNTTLGDTLKLKIGIEENLPKSLFTVDMKITTEQMSLTPDSRDLTISSEVGVDGKPTFYMTKAITWEEYNGTASVLDSDSKYRKYFTCPLKTNTTVFRDVDISYGAGDRIIVTNDNFETATTLFMAGNITLKRFINLHLDKEYFVAGRPATISFGMTKLPDDRNIFVGLKSLKPNDASLESAGTDEEGYTLYEIPVSSIDSESLELIPTASSGMAYVKLVKEGEFNPVYPLEKEIKTPGFDDLRFNYQNLGYVVSNKEALACFHMDYLPLNDAKVTIHLKNAVPVDGTAAGTPVDGYTPYQIAVTDNDFEFPVKITPASDSDTTAYFYLTADNYNPSAVAEATIQKLQFSGLELINENNPTKNYVVGGKPARISFSLDDMPGEGNVIKLMLSNLTIPEGAAMSHGTYQKVSDTEYTLSITDKDDVTIEVIPEMGATSASYTLSDTTSEFDTKTCEANVQKLSFINPRLVNTNDPTAAYVVGGKPAYISFSLEDMPSSANQSITLTMTNLTPVSTDPTSGEMTGISSFSGSAGSYTFVPSSKNITINVTPTAGDNLKASYSLSNTEFKPTGNGVSNVEIKKLTFSNLNFNCPDGKTYLLAGGQASITFSVDQQPSDPDNKVTLYIKNAAPLGQTVYNDGQFHEYSVPVDSKTKTLNITVATGVTEAEFYLSDNEFYAMTDAQHAKASIKTRYTIDWSKVLIKSDETGNPAQGNTAVSVYTSYNSTNCTCSGEATALGGYKSFTTTSSGYASASATQTFVDSADGAETYYFMFKKGGVDYISEDGVSLADLAKTTTVPQDVQVICKIQMVEYNINAGKLYFVRSDNAALTGTTITYYTSSDSTNRTFTSSTTGYNPSKLTFKCKPGTTITFSYYKNGNWNGQATVNIADIADNNNHTIKLQ